jgi:hypothetical protein
MKKLSLEQASAVEGGGFVDGVCAVVGFTEAGIAVRALAGRAVAFAVPGVGPALTIAAVGCFVYALW